MTAAGPSWIDQVKAWPVPDVAARFGLEPLARGRDVSFPCPVCGKERRHTHGRDDRRAAKVMPEGRWWCEPCGAHGDAVALACASVTGQVGQLEPARWPDVRRACVERGLCLPDGQNVRLTATVASQRAIPPVAEPLGFPLAAGVSDFWEACRPVTPGDAAGAYLAGRGFDLERLRWAHMARLAPARLPRPLAWWPEPWLRGWPLVVPGFDAGGHLVTVHARAVSRDVEPKTRWPRGHSASGVLFADAMGRDFLRLTAALEPVTGLEAVVIAEGATDTLKLASVLEGADATFGTLGYVAGSKRALERVDWPPDVACVVAVDDDLAGDRYAAEVRQALDVRVRVWRVRAPQGRDSEGRKVADWSDLTDAAVRATLGDPSRWEVCRG